MDVPINYKIDKDDLNALLKALKSAQKETVGAEKELEDMRKKVKDIKTESDGLGKVFSSLKGVIGALGVSFAFSEAARAVAQTVQATNKLKNEITALTNVSGAQLDSVTAKIIAISKAFDKDYRDVLLATNALAKAFSITQIEALDEIKKGFINGADIAGEYLELLKEYPPNLREIGLSAKQAIEFLTLTQKSGIFSDQGVATLEEALLRLREMPQATKDALASIGLSATAIQKDVASGSKTLFQVVQEISTRLSQLRQDAPATGQAIADIFGAAGEKAGYGFIITIKDLGKEMEDTSTEAKNLKQRNEELLAASENLATQIVIFSSNFRDLTTDIQVFLRDAGAGLLKFFNDLADPVANKVENSVLWKAKDNLALLRLELEELQEKQNTVSGVLRSVFGLEDPTEVREKITLVTQAIERQKKIIEDLEKAKTTAKPPPGSDPLSSEQKKLIEQYRKLVNASRDFSTALTPEELKALSKAFQELELKAFKLKNTLENISLGQEDKLKKQLKDIQEEIKNIGLDKLSLGDTDALLDQAEALRKKGLERAKEAERKATEIVEEEEARRLELREEAFRGAYDIAGAYYDFIAAKRQADLSNLQDKTDFELSLVGDNEQAKRAILLKSAQEEKSIRKQQARDQKASSIFDILLNTARGVVAALASVPPNVPLSVGIGIIGGIQAGLVAAKPLPFKHGTKGVPGIDTGDDSVHALLRPGEKVFPVETSRKYAGLLDAIFDNKIDPAVANFAFKMDPDIINKFSKSQSPIVINQNNDALVKAFKKSKSIAINIDKKGFRVNTHQAGQNIEKDINEYKM